MKLKRKEYGNKSIEYSIIKSKRIKTSEIIVDKDKVVVRTPFHKSLLEVEKIIQSKSSWIIKKQLEYQSAVSEIKKPTFEAGSTLPYLGKNYPIRIVHNQTRKKDKIEFVNEEFLISLVNSKPSKRNIESLYEEWLIRKAHAFFKKKVKWYSKKLEVQPSQIIVKDLKNRWGSTTKDNVINLNVNLLKTPSDVIDYMVLHELCHLKIKEHSHSFWDLVYKFMPNYQEKVNWLKLNGIVLVQ